MAAPRSSSASVVSPDTLITIKIAVNDHLKKLKLPLRDLDANALLDKLRHALDLQPEQHVVLERYSDSFGDYVVLDPNNPRVFKTLIRAAKAKLKLRLKATVTPAELPTNATEDKKVTEKMKTVSTMTEPASTPRGSTALDRRSVGSGIFQFKEARASQQTPVGDEAPVPQPFKLDQLPANNRASVSTGPAALTSVQPPHASLASCPREAAASASTPSPKDWCFYCNECDKALHNEHFHCSTCDGGDYDLCQGCIDNGKHCRRYDHWLIKRVIHNGQLCSTNECMLPRRTPPPFTPIKPEPAAVEEISGAFTEETKTLAEEPQMETRTCNCCLVVLPGREFVTCSTCDDFDLCINCHLAEKHGHHPAHAFKPATVETVLSLAGHAKLGPGRSVRHNAICDGCDRGIFGVRHKCLNCPNFDYCGACIGGAHQTHPRHRFAPLYQPIPDQAPAMVWHEGTYCAGLQCSSNPVRTCIQGIRYKCTICHDTDLCASCEALPNNQHNRTHPLIKLKTPVGKVNVSTENEDVCGNVRVMGDRPSSVQDCIKSAPPEPTPQQPLQQPNAATQVQTVAEFTPTPVKKEEIQSISIPAKNMELNSAFSTVESPVALATPNTLLNAQFVRDSVQDGTLVEPEQVFTQVWTLRNPGPYPWPAGCSVRYVGGDNMLNVDNCHPDSVAAIAEATESNVVSREIQISEEVAFKVVLKAPFREGKSISYWRMKAADGTPFGHRLWCDVEVKKPAAPFAASAPVPRLPPCTDRQSAMERMQQMQKIQQARQDMMQDNFERMEIAQQGLQMASVPPRVGPVTRPVHVSSSEQPPAYDSMGLHTRLSVMREQQKQRREQMVAQLNAQRDALQAQGIDRPRPWACTKPEVAGNEKERREALKQRVAHIKANILKTREKSDKLAEETKMLARESGKQNSVNAATKSAENTAHVKEIAAVPNQHEQNETNEDLETSQMVFPTLDKESPSSSTYQSATSGSGKGKAENETEEAEHSATPVAVPSFAPALKVEEDLAEDFFDLDDDDLEVLSANGNESDSDDFMTDEEYDILDASDQDSSL